MKLTYLETLIGTKQISTKNKHVYIVKLILSSGYEISKIKWDEQLQKETLTFISNEPSLLHVKAWLQTN